MIESRATRKGVDDAQPDAPARILQAAQEELVLRGAGALAMHDVADRAGVSKGLIHYHYQDKDALLARVAVRLGERIAERARGALATSTAPAAVDDLRRWVDAEIALGEWRGLLALAEWPAADVRSTAHGALGARRVAVSGLMGRLFSVLAVRPRIGRVAIAELAIALVSGLVAESSGNRASSMAIDAIVLALLGLSE